MEPSGRPEFVETTVYGRVYEDTEFFDDLDNDPSCYSNARIQEIQILYSEVGRNITVVKGLVVTYQDGRKGSHIGTDEKKTVVASLSVDPDESIIGVSGRRGNLIDRLVITTNKGRTLIAGGTGGSPFEFKIPDNYKVLGFRGGLGGHIHNLSLVLTSMRP